ncbi:MAG: DciA family protein [Pseudomonadota bacterium]|nr:DciA family protein [Pseudomonadota bacterium]
MKEKPSLELRPETLDRAPVLKELMARARAHQQAEKKAIAALPPALAEGTRFVSYREGELVLSASNGPKASQIRYRQHELMAELRKCEVFRYVWKLTVKVVPPRFSEAPETQHRPLSKENARLLREEAGHTKDKRLREVLEKLASHVQD